MAAAQLEAPDNGGMAPCVEEADDYPEEDMEGEEAGDFPVQLGATYCCRRADGSYRDGEVVKLRMNKRAGREEYLIHYAGLTRRQAEWVDKTRLMLSNPIKEEEDVENGTDQKMSETGKATRNQRSEEDEPETKKAKFYTSAVVPKNKEITCLLCSELYKDPVIVQCGHSFCRSCINEAWANRDSFSCPDCNKVITERNLTTNFALAYILKTTVGDGAKHVENVKTRSDVNCPEHDEKLKLYCKKDGILSCIICRDSPKHSGHTFLPIVDAVEMYQAKLSSVRSLLEEAWKESSELTVQQSEKVEQLQNTIMECRQHVLSEFAKLYSFLIERKKKLLRQLQAEAPGLLEEMETCAARLKQNRDAIKESMVVVREKEYETDPAVFLDGMDNFVKKVREQLEAVNLTLTGIRQKQLCRGTFKGPVQYFTWKEMKSIILVTDNEEQPEQQEKVPESSSEASVINDSVPDNGQQPVPPRQEVVPESPMDPPVICNSVPEYEQQPVPLRQEEVPEGPMDLPVIKDSVPECEKPPVPPRHEEVLESPMVPPVISDLECEKQPDPLRQNEVSECPMDLPVIQEYVTECEQKSETLQQKEVPESLIEPAVTKHSEAHVQQPTPPEQDKIEHGSINSLGLINSGAKEIWLFGNDYMNAANYRAQNGPLGLNLGFKKETCTIRWFELDNLCECFLAKLQNATSFLNPPDIIFFHSGYSDLSCADFALMIQMVPKGLTEAANLFPNAVFILSWLYPRTAGLGDALDHCRKQFQAKLYFFVRKPGFHRIRHERLAKRLSARSSTEDITTLMDDETDQFIEHIQRALQKNLPPGTENVKPSSGVFPLSEPDKASAGKDTIAENVQDVERTDVPQTSADPSGADVPVPSEEYKEDEEEEVKNPEPAPGTDEEAPGVADSPALPDTSGVKQIWIVGNSYICRAARRANGSSYGSNMGFDLGKWKVHWMGRIAMRWEALLPDLKSALSTLGAPHIIFVHLGDNDLGCTPCGTLTEAIAGDLTYLAKQLPSTEFIFSTILPRADWLTNPLEQNRKDVNIFLAKHAGELGFHVATHDNLEETATPRFKSGGSNVISDSEYDMFMKSIRESVEKAMLKVE